VWVEPSGLIKDESVEVQPATLGGDVVRVAERFAADRSVHREHWCARVAETIAAGRIRTTARSGSVKAGPLLAEDLRCRRRPASRLTELMPAQTRSAVLPGDGPLATSKRCRVGRIGLFWTAFRPEGSTKGLHTHRTLESLQVERDRKR
jgi:hypothetical protein